MVAVSSDSRLKLTRPGTQKRSAAAEDSADSGQSIEIEAQSEAEPVSDSEPVAAAKKTTKPKKKKKKVLTIPEKKTNTSSASKKKVNSKKTETTDHDFDQDTDEGSVVVRSQGGKARKDNIANVEEFFYPPTYKQGDPEGINLSYKCRWCNGVYRSNITSNGNLVSHRDGYTQLGKSARGCVNRDKAKLAGIKLPPSVAERRMMETNLNGDQKQTGIAGFLEVQPPFLNRVLNQLIMIWQIRQALPWSRIEDPYLRAAFQYVSRKAILYGRRWSSDESKALYSMLKSNVFTELN
ncbi:hypothetical protein PTTG_30695, partial [Puccinia triticina 1-1 BBBD Race 1]